ncbi:hypothetical protein LX16_0045 [Stackebrandtia albiflava]|uniref:Uncharacterized protein n=1 Tax=Stackebrandtia albiflava TaxID=406432 RepID=A0A562VGV9_9ACTN|nr:hypothetical protein [Stackebrandtia albiflava]TWJ17129.1 hypothetical protein LX16_0045 [Stackebrandtia albiflava]
MPSPPKKTNTALILVLVAGLLGVMCLGGAGVWFFGFGGSDMLAGGEPYEFPAEYDPELPPAPTGVEYVFDFPAGYDLCATLDLSGVNAVLPFEGLKEPGMDDRGGGRGWVSCNAQMRSTVEYRDTRPTGIFYVDFGVLDPENVQGEYDRIWESYPGYAHLTDLDIGDQAEVHTKTENNVLSVILAFRNGNVSGMAEIGVNYGEEHDAPAPEMLGNVLIDVVNDGLTKLAP